MSDWQQPLTPSDGREVHPPSDAVHPAQWVHGYTLFCTHYRSPMLGHCVSCGSPAAHCPAWYHGWELMRGSLADPGTLPATPPA